MAVEVLRIIRIATIKVPQVVDAEAFATFIHLFDFVTPNIEVHDGQPVVLFLIRLRRVDQAFCTAGFRGEHGLFLKENRAALTAPIPEVSLDHGEYQVLMLNRGKARIRSIPLFYLAFLAQANCGHGCELEQFLECRHDSIVALFRYLYLNY